MHISMFGIVICALVGLAWSAVGLHCRLLARRVRRVEWEELMRHYPDLDRELDRVWRAR